MGMLLRRHYEKPQEVKKEVVENATSPIVEPIVKDDDKPKRGRKKAEE